METIPIKVFGAWLYKRNGIPAKTEVPEEGWDILVLYPGEYGDIAEVQKYYERSM